jgi:hypothetical protein
MSLKLGHGKASTHNRPAPSPRLPDEETRCQPTKLLYRA